MGLSEMKAREVELEPYKGFTATARYERGMWRGEGKNAAGEVVKFCDTQAGFLQSEFRYAVNKSFRTV